MLYYYNFLTVVLRKEKLKQQREYRKKRNLKKKMRAKEKEAESEISKNKWMDFNKKISSKNAKGLVRYFTKLACAASCAFQKF